VLSVVVVVLGMARELPRTLLSLAPDYQRGVDAEEYEIGVVDNLGEATALFEGRVTRNAQVARGFLQDRRVRVRVSTACYQRVPVQARPLLSSQTN
jgi:hypothetical protein